MEVRDGAWELLALCPMLSAVGIDLDDDPVVFERRK